jgi:DNA-binding NarL/FixJ family response regulator
VAAAVTDGLSNPKIAERLLITRRTVTTHLTSIYRKLGVSTRAELAATATRHQHETQDTSTHGTDRPDPATSSKGRPA